MRCHENGTMPFAREFMVGKRLQGIVLAIAKFRPNLAEEFFIFARHL